MKKSPVIIYKEYNTTARNSNAKSVSTSMTMGQDATITVYDPEFNMEVIPIFDKTNTKLEQQISTVEQQALKNYDKKNN